MKAMKIYTIATKSTQCHGHGDYSTEDHICRTGSYGTGEFPPAFKTKEEAEKHLAGIEWNSQLVVVELELR
jgi:hypothetical protein